MASKLSVEAASAIRRTYTNGKHSQDALARMYKVHPKTVWNIVHKNTYKDSTLRPSSNETVTRRLNDRD